MSLLLSTNITAEMSKLVLAVERAEEPTPLKRWNASMMQDSLQHPKPRWKHPMISATDGSETMAFASSFSIDSRYIGLNLKKMLSIYSDCWRWKQIAKYFSTSCPKTFHKDAQDGVWGFFRFQRINGGERQKVFSATLKNLKFSIRNWQLWNLAMPFF